MKNLGGSVYRIEDSIKKKFKGFMATFWHLLWIGVMIALLVITPDKLTACTFAFVIGLVQERHWTAGK